MLPPVRAVDDDPHGTIALLSFRRVMVDQAPPPRNWFNRESTIVDSRLNQRAKTFTPWG